MGKRKLSQKGLILIAGTVAGCIAGGISYASTPPAAPSVPTAPVLPAFQEMVLPAYGSGTSESYGVSTPPPIVPAQFAAGGYSTIKDPSSLASYDTPPEITPGGNYSQGVVVGPNSCASAVVENDSLVATGSPGNPLWISTDATQMVAIPVLGNATLGALVAESINDPIEITQDLTIADGSSNYATGSYSSYYDVLDGSTPTTFSNGLFAVGGGGYAWLKITSGGTLNTSGTFAMASSGPAGGTFVGSPYGLRSDIASYTSPPGSSATYLNFGGKTNYGVVNVAGGNWNASNSPLFVGFGGVGFVTNNGGTIELNNTSLLLGEATSLGGSAGTVVLKGGKLASTGTGGYVIVGAGGGLAGFSNGLYVTQGASATIASAVVVGDGTSSTLAVESAGVLQSASGYAGGAAAKLTGPIGQNFLGGFGNIVIDGVSSSWAISGNADFGVSGGAIAAVQNHGDLNISGTLTLGDQSTGSGTLTVQADGTVESGDATLGNQAGATGFADVSNINTLWTVDGDLTIGNSGQGTLTLSNNGEVVTTGAGILGSQAGSTGSATITDAGTEWQINGDLKVGDKGNATMQVENGGYVSLAGNLDIADSGGTSTLTLDGANSRMIAGGTSVTIGGQGDGTLMVQNAADAVFSGASVSLGEKSSGTGTLTVEGSNTIMSTGSLTIGGYGTGTVNVQDSAALSTATNISLGEQASGTGTATIDSASVTDAGTLTVGGYGTGTMSIQNSGSLTVQGNSVTLGEQAGGSGTLNIIGNGSSLIFSGDLTVGESGSGDFELQNGGQFGGVSMTVGAGSGFGGASTGGAGTVEISGAGSSLSLSQDLTVGKYGQGTITLAGGGSLIDQGDVTLGSVTASNGTVNVNTGSIWMLSGGLTIGSKGYGTVVVNGASNLKSTGDSITVGKQGAGELTVSGNQSLLTYTGDLAIGDEATGTLNVQSGGGIQYSGNTSNVDIAETAGITGTVTVTDSGSTMAADNLVLAGKSSGSGGNGILNVENGGILTVANDMTMWKNASLNVTGGSITVGTVGSGTAPLNTLQVNTSGNLAAGGTLTGNLVNNQGVIALGKILPESLNITGGFSQSGGTLKVLIAGSSDFSQLNATGAVNISGGTIEFDFINGFAPKSGETFQFLDPPQAVSIANTAYTFTGLASGFTFGVNSDANGLLFTALSNGVATTSPIPEPATLALLAMAGAGMLLLRKRRGFVKR